MTAVAKSQQFGTHECRKWRGEIFTALPSLAEDLAEGFLYVAKRHGNAAGNRWLARNAQGLVDPERVYRRFEVIAEDLRRGAQAIRRRQPTTIEGIKAANAWLVSVEERLSLGGFNASHDDDALAAYAETQARAVEDDRHKRLGSIAEHNRLARLGLLPNLSPVTQGAGPLSAQARRRQLARARARNPLSPPPIGTPLMAVFTWQRVPLLSKAGTDAMAAEAARERARLHGIEPPSPRSPVAFQLARLGCPRWWRRKLRRLAGRRLEQVQREAHRVHAQAGIYCSNLTLDRRKSQKARNRALLETLEAINQEGQTYTLAELAELGLANPDHRRAELMLRIRDTEVEARRLGHVGMFYTITAPSRFHPVLHKSARRNPKYNGATPREAQQHIQQVWARARAQLAREEIGIYGLRVVEPHHDGTPHWHLELFMKPEDEPRVTEVLRSYAEADTPEELYDRRGHKTDSRFKPKRIDYSRGTAAGYIAKYIAKNINGQQFMEADKYDHPMNSSAPRIEAWAATWGIRQFQFLGLPSVTVWREVRRLTEKQEEQLRQWEEATRPDPDVASRLHLIRKAANAGQWDLFLRLMGGPNTPRKQQPIKPWRVVLQDAQREPLSHATGELDQGCDARGRYGDTVTVTWGLVVNDGRGTQAEYLTRLYRWEVRSRHRRQAEGSPGPDEVGAPWTCVTNCTPAGTAPGKAVAQVDTTPRVPSEAEQVEQLRRYQEWVTTEEHRAEMASVELEARLVRAAARRLFAPRPQPQPEPEEYFPPELC